MVVCMIKNKICILCWIFQS